MSPGHRLLAFLASFACAAIAANVTATLSSSGIAQMFDGIGALSAGASSRLLWDYAEPQRTQILDYLFKPQFGAALSILKVEIGGGVQSTDGTEFTHRHDRSTPADCSGLQYEGWLIQEAKARNPSILTYGLSWGVPGWVGNNSYYSEENIGYQTSWVACVKKQTTYQVDFLGLWNEKPQPPDATYVLSLKAALSDAGFESTRVIVMDGGWDTAEFSLAKSNASFASSVYGAGLHYPCNQPHPETAEVGWALWASEDYSRDPNWDDGGTYWGKALSQNFVLMNATATISWSLIWSAYTNLVCNGAGLMRAHTPWSGNYEASAPIWLSAHTTQFAVPGWRYLSVESTGSGLITSASGKPAGTWVALVPPSGSVGLTVVIETLVNDACLARSYEPVTVNFRVSSGAPLPAPGTTLFVWRSRRDALFVQDADIQIAADGTFSLSLLPDEMVTASTTAGASHGNFSTPIPESAPWPLPFSEGFDELADGQLARFFSDQGGEWAARAGEYVQLGFGDPGANGWGADWPPTTQFGDESWADYSVSVAMRFNISGPYPDSSSQTGSPNGPLFLADCDSSDVAQSFVTGPAANYLQNVANGGCIDVNGCGTLVDSYSCVVGPPGNGCGGPTCDGSLQTCNEMWSYDEATGHVSSFMGNVLTAFVNGSLYSLPLTAGAQQSWDFNKTSGQISPRGSTKCISSQPRQSFIRLCGRTASFSGFGGVMESYCIEIRHTGAYALLAYVNTANPDTLASGTLSDFDPTTKHVLSLTFAGPLISAAVDNVSLASVEDTRNEVGNVLVGGGWHSIAFDDVLVTSS